MNWLPSFLRRDSIESEPGGWWPKWSLWGGAAQFNDYNSDVKKMQTVLSSPAALKVFALLMDLYALGKIYEYKGEEEVKDSKNTVLFDQPNPFQSQSQWKKTYMFWNLLGNANLYIDKDSIDNNKLYFLIPHKMEMPKWFKDNEDKLFFTSSRLNELSDQKITYRYNDGTSILIPFKKIIQYFDLSNGVGNWFKGNSRLDALCKIIDISEAALDAKKINVQFSGQFLVAGAADAQDARSKALGPDEKRDIEGKVRSEKPVHALKSMIEIHRFVSDMGNLKLDEAFFASAFQIGNLYGIPKDVLELYLSSSTYENQEKAKGAVVSYCLEPRAEDMLAPISKRVLIGKNRRFVMSWDHLPFMQYAESERADVQLKRSVTIRNLQQAGASTQEINAYLDTNFENLTTTSNEAKTNTGDQGNGAGGESQGNAVQS